MNKKQKQISLLVILIISVIAINYHFLDNVTSNFLLNQETALVTRVIDGDTIEIETLQGEIKTVRLLGINTPERSEKFYNEAKEFLETQVLGKKIFIEKTKDDKDLYQRLLRYVFVDNKNANIELVRQGYANIYYPASKDIYYSEFENVWQGCLNSNINLCEKSQDVCADCIELVELNVKEQLVVLQNQCDFSCNLKNWEIKDEGRKKFSFESFILKRNSKVKVLVDKTKTKKSDNEIIYWQRSDYVWTSGGDTLFLRDSDGKLVLHYNY